MEKVVPLIKTLNMNNNWLKQSQYTSLKKLLFENGYFDFTTNKFYDKKPTDTILKFYLWGKFTMILTFFMMKIWNTWKMYAKDFLQMFLEKKLETTLFII